MKRFGAKAWCATALCVVAISSCRFRYEQLELLPSDGGGVTANGGETASGGRSFGGASGGSGSMDGGAGSTDEGGAGSAVAVGGAGAATGGTASGTGGTDSGGTDTGGSDTGVGGAPGLCVPDATCSCEGFQGHDYRFCSVPAIRASGLAACQSANMVLVRVDSAEEDAWLLQQFIDHGMFIGAGDPIVILGGNDIEVEGTWRWDDGTLFWDGAPVGDVYANFAFAPKTGPGDCLGMMSDGRWADRACSSGNATVACESP